MGRSFGNGLSEGSESPFGESSDQVKSRSSRGTRFEVPSGNSAAAAERRLSGSCKAIADERVSSGMRLKAGPVEVGRSSERQTEADFVKGSQSSERQPEAGFRRAFGHSRGLRRDAAWVFLRKSQRRVRAGSAVLFGEQADRLGGQLPNPSGFGCSSIAVFRSGRQLGASSDDCRGLVMPGRSTTLGSSAGGGPPALRSGRTNPTAGLARNHSDQVGKKPKGASGAASVATPVS